MAVSAEHLRRVPESKEFIGLALAGLRADSSIKGKYNSQFMVDYGRIDAVEIARAEAAQRDRQAEQLRKAKAALFEAQREARVERPGMRARELQRLQNAAAIARLPLRHLAQMRPYLIGTAVW